MGQKTRRDAGHHDVADRMAAAAVLSQPVGDMCAGGAAGAEAAVQLGHRRVVAVELRGRIGDRSHERGEPGAVTEREQHDALPVCPSGVRDGEAGARARERDARREQPDPRDRDEQHTPTEQPRQPHGPAHHTLQGPPLEFLARRPSRRLGSASVGSTSASHGITTRREFLQSGAAAGAMLTLPALAGCGSSSNDDRIVRAAIHPAVGIGRVGNSQETFFFGPEVPGALPRASGGFKDAHGAVARQAARFRVYGLDRNGRVVRELTAGDAEITWRVDVANSNGGVVRVRDAVRHPGRPSRRPAQPRAQGSSRSRLAVAPPGRSVSGAAKGPVALEGGSFLGEPVALGELMTDGQGRLVVLPAQGRGYSPGAKPLGSFSENPGWTDDVCDGPVRASVKLGNRVLEAEPAWVIVTPPNYAPAMANGVVTAYDAARSTFVDAGMLGAGAVSFEQDILPIFARLVDLQWVSAGFLQSNGFGSAHDWLADGMPERLADRSSRNAAFRRAVFQSFRDPSFRTSQPNAVPELYGDHVSFKTPNSRVWLAVTPLQYRNLRLWAQGDFTDDRERAGARLTR